MKTITAPDAPASIGPFAQAIAVGDFLFCSGQVALDSKTMQLVSDNIADQTKQVFKNIHSVLQAAELEFSDLVKTTVYLSDMSCFSEMNQVYGDTLGKHKPARTTVEVARLPLDALVEIECIASLKR